MVLDEEPSIVDVDWAVGVHAGTLGNSVGLERVEPANATGLPKMNAVTSPREAENTQLRMERDLLKR